MKLEKHVITKEKTDLLSSLKKIDKNIIEKSFNYYDVYYLEELKETIIEEFKYLLNTAKSDIHTRNYFTKLIENENTLIFSACEEDVEKFLVFVYEAKDSYKYYIPDEIKKIIKKELEI